MKNLLALFLLSSVAVASEPLKIAIIDTGLDLNDKRFTHLCPTGHDFFAGKSIKDVHGHGTHIAGLIQQYAGDGDYCFLIYKFYSESNTGQQNLLGELASINSAIRNGAKIINLSEGGPEFNENEYLAVKNHPNILFVVAAGNENRCLDVSGNEYYPASYWQPNETVVENYTKNDKLYPGSNWSKKAVHEVGDNVYSTLPVGYGYMTGTSQATAIRTGKIVREILNKRDK